MGIGVSIFLLALGAILAFAVDFEASGLDINTVGVILMVVGAIGLATSFLFWDRMGFGGRRRRVAASAPTTSTTASSWAHPAPPCASAPSCATTRSCNPLQPDPSSRGSRRPPGSGPPGPDPEVGRKAAGHLAGFAADAVLGLLELLLEQHPRGFDADGQRRDPLREQLRLPPHGGVDLLDDRPDVGGPGAGSFDLARDGVQLRRQSRDGGRRIGDRTIGEVLDPLRQPLELRRQAGNRLGCVRRRSRHQLADL